jgi:hypothetical protein
MTTPRGHAGPRTARDRKSQSGNVEDERIMAKRVKCSLRIKSCSTFLNRFIGPSVFREGLAPTLMDGKSSRVLAAFAASLAEWPIGHSNNEKFCSSPNHPEGCKMLEWLLSQQRNSTTSKLNTIVRFPSPAPEVSGTCQAVIVPLDKRADAHSDKRPSFVPAAQGQERCARMVGGARSLMLAAEQAATPRYRTSGARDALR